MRKCFFACISTFCIAFASNLIQDAKEAGILPIPSDEYSKEELIKKHSPDYDKFPTTKARVEVGKKLYFDPRLSKSGLISCNTCHNLGLGGADGIPAAIGHKWVANPSHINSPTTFNSVFNSAQFWDGRALHLADQAKGPMLATPEMAATPKMVEDRVFSMPEYVNELKAAFPGESLNFDLIATAIGIFERTLITPSKFDKFLEGDENALSELQKEGFRLFLEKGCAFCHNGVNLGGTMQPFEVASKYKFASLGGFKGDASGMVKAPTLRNVALTAPYFHNGAIWSLEEAVKTMGSVQLGISIQDEEASKIAEFLHSLTGELEPVVYPNLPASSYKTPKPISD